MPEAQGTGPEGRIPERTARHDRTLPFLNVSRILQASGPPRIRFRDAEGLRTVRDVVFRSLPRRNRMKAGCRVLFFGNTFRGNRMLNTKGLLLTVRSGSSGNGIPPERRRRCGEGVRIVRREPSRHLRAHQEEPFPGLRDGESLVRRSGVHAFQKAYGPARRHENEVPRRVRKTFALTFLEKRIRYSRKPDREVSGKRHY